MYCLPFGVGLHIFLLLVYLSLIVVWLRKSVHSIVFELQEGNEATSRLSLMLQIYIIFFSAILVYFIQRVSISRNLLRRQPLTITHDITSAWQGLAAAVFGLCNQLIVNASFWGVSGVVAYLGCVSILHIVTPSLFTLQLFNATSPLTITTTLALPNATSIEFLRAYEDVTGPALSFLSRLQFNSPGLMGSTIFDVLQPSSGFGNVTVNAATFNVTCGSVPGRLVSQPAAVKMTNYYLPFDSSTLIFLSEQTGEPLAVIDWQNLPPNMPNSTASQVAYFSSNYASQAILISTYNFSDSDGVVDSIYTLPSTVQMKELETAHIESGYYGYNVSAIQVLGCSLSVINHTAIVDVLSGNLVETQPVSFASEWTPLVLVNSSTSDFFDGWASMFYDSPSTDDILYWGPSAADNLVYSNIANIDSVIMQSLGMPPFSAAPLGSPIPQITLAMLEEVIANVTALTFWATARANNLTGPVDLLTRSPTSSYLLPSEVVTYQATLLYRVNLNTLQLWVSVVLASILLFLSIALTSGSDMSSPVKEFSLLQTLWLSYRHSDIKKLMLKIKDPSANELRRRGMMTQVTLSGELDDDAIDMDLREHLVSNNSSNN